MSRTQRLFEAIRTNYVKDECATKDVAKCLDRIYSNLVRHEQTVGAELKQNQCADANFAEIMDNIRSVINAPKSDAANAIKAFVDGVMPIVNADSAKLDLLKTYYEIVVEKRRNKQTCFINQYDRLLKMLLNVHEFYRNKCAVKFSNACLKQIVAKLRPEIKAVADSLSSVQCSENKFLSVFTMLQKGMDLPNTVRIDAIKEFGDADLVDSDVDVAAYYRDIMGLSGRYYECMLLPWIRGFEMLHVAVQECADDNCFKGLVKTTKAVLSTSLEQQECKAFDTVRERLRNDIKLPEALLIVSLERYASQPITKTVLDFIQSFEKTMDVVYDTAKHGCGFEQLNSIKIALEHVHEAANECSKNDDTDRCYANAIAKFRADIDDSMLDRLQATGCVDHQFAATYWQIKNGLIALKVQLIESLKKFAAVSIRREVPNFTNIYKQIDDAVKANNLGCANESAVQTIDLLNDVHFDGQKCQEDQTTSCYEHAYDMVKQHLMELKQTLQASNCQNTVLNAVVDDVNSAFRMKHELLVDAFIQFVRTPLDNGRVTVAFLTSTDNTVLNMKQCLDNEAAKIARVRELYAADIKVCQQMVVMVDAEECVKNEYNKVQAYFKSSAVDCAAVGITQRYSCDELTTI